MEVCDINARIVMEPVCAHMVEDELSVKRVVVQLYVSMVIKGMYAFHVEEPAFVHT